MGDREVNEDILNFLSTFKAKAPITLLVMKRYLSAYSVDQLKSSLIRLQRKGLVRRIGIRRQFNYTISSEGLAYLNREEDIAIIENMKTELEKLEEYFQLNGGYE